MRRQHNRNTTFCQQRSGTVLASASGQCGATGIAAVNQILLHLLGGGDPMKLIKRAATIPSMPTSLPLGGYAHCSGE